MPPPTVNKAIAKLVQGERLITYKGLKDQEQKPELITGTNASFYIVQPQDVIVTPKKAAEKGWITAKSTGFSLSGRSGAEIRSQGTGVGLRPAPGTVPADDSNHPHASL